MQKAKAQYRLLLFSAMGCTKQCDHDLPEEVSPLALSLSVSAWRCFFLGPDDRLNRFFFRQKVPSR